MSSTITTKPLEKLTDEQKTSFQKVLKEAAQNKFLGGDEEKVIPKKRCIVILFGEKTEPVGFYTPRKQNLLGVNHWRAGTLFVLKSHQGKGIMKQVLADFFASHQPGLSWIEDSNMASTALFRSLGFRRDKERSDDPDRPGHWWIRDKTAVALEGYSW
jgi:RimJ/RimL family protein N-acetyltransferase